MAKVATTGSSVTSSGERAASSISAATRIEHTSAAGRWPARAAGSARPGPDRQQPGGRRQRGTRGGCMRTARSASIAASGPSSPSQHAVADRGDAAAWSKRNGAPMT